MKKFALLFGALAFTLFVGCTNDGTDDTPGLSDGAQVAQSDFYIVGEALDAEKPADGELPAALYRMSKGYSVPDPRTPRAGLYEKYVALEAGKPFSIVQVALNADGVPVAPAVYYGAELAPHAAMTDSKRELAVSRGELVVGTDAPAMTVERSGLYHVVADFNIAGDLAYPMVMLLPVDWGMKGVNGDWNAWDKLSASAFDLTTITWSGDYSIFFGGRIKLANHGALTVALDSKGVVKAYTSLGDGMVPTGNAMEKPNLGNAKATLTWTLAGGEIASGYTFEITGSEDITLPSDYAVGFSGTAVGDWNAVYGVGTYDEKQSQVTNKATLAGTYVYTATDVSFNEGDFKVRYNDGYFGPNDSSLSISGMPELETVTGGDGIVNYLVTPALAGTYDVEYTVEYDGKKATSIAVALTKTSDSPSALPAGVYVEGEALGEEEITSLYRMEATSDGVYRKYIALRGGQPFAIVDRTGGTPVSYGAALSPCALTEKSGEVATSGVIVAGDTAPQMSVAKDGVYHIIVDKAPAEPQILIVPMDWSVRGTMSDWSMGDVMTVSEFGADKVTWTKSYSRVDAGSFKFAYGGCDTWSFLFGSNQNADTPYITNIGTGGFDKDSQNIIVKTLLDVTFSLTWTLERGVGEFTYDVQGTPDVNANAVMEMATGLSGNCFEGVGIWVAPEGAARAKYDSAACVVSDQSSLAGTYVYNIDSVTFCKPADSTPIQFKVRFINNPSDGGNGWFGPDSKMLTVTGIDGLTSYQEAEYNFNFTIPESSLGTYGARITVEYNGSSATRITAEFAKK